MTRANGNSPNDASANVVPISRALCRSVRPRKITIANDGPSTINPAVTGTSATADRRAPSDRWSTTAS